MTLSPRAIEVGARALWRASTYHGYDDATLEREWDRMEYIWRSQAAAVLTALAAEGYVVAPREPTTQQMEAAGNAVAEYAKKMTQAGGDVDAMDYALRAVIYRAMIAAAQEISNASD